ILEPRNQVQRLAGELLADQLHFLHADAMLPGDGTALCDAKSQNLVARRFGALQFLRLAVIEQDDGVHVAIARVENVADGEAVLLGDPVNLAQRRRNLSARHHAILYVVYGTHPANRTEGVLATLPYQFALGRGLCNANRSRATAFAVLLGLRQLFFPRSLRSLQFEQQ